MSKNKDIKYSVVLSETQWNSVKLSETQWNSVKLSETQWNSVKLSVTQCNHYTENHRGDTEIHWARIWKHYSLTTPKSRMGWYFTEFIGRHCVTWYLLQRLTYWHWREFRCVCPIFLFDTLGKIYFFMYICRFIIK